MTSIASLSQALIMPLYPTETSLIYFGPRVSEIGTNSVVNTGTLGGVLSTSGGNLVDANGVVISQYGAGTEWVQSGGADGIPSSAIGEIFEFWAIHTVLHFTGDIQTLALGGQSFGTLLSVALGTDAFGYAQALAMQVAGGTAYITESPVTLSSWNHFAFSRDSNDLWTYYVNGIARATTTVAFANTAKTFSTGTDISTDSTLTVANVRYRTGVAYSGTFTPPARVYV